MQITNSLNLPQPLVDAVTSNYRYKEKQYSVTTILNGNKNIILTRRHYDEITQDVADMGNLILGTAFHKVCEEGKATANQLQEGYLIYELPNGYKLSGRMDLYDEEKKIVWDYKTCSVNKVLFKETKEWMNQLLIYCWLLNKSGFDCDKGSIIAYFKDFSPTKATVLAEYPNHQFMTIEWAFNEEMKKDIENRILEKFESIARDEQLPDDEIAPCSEEERWYKGTTYAVKKIGNKTAKRVFTTEEEAKAFIESDKDKDKLMIEYREGANTKCEHYCSCANFCNFFKKWQKEHSNDERAEGL